MESVSDYFVFTVLLVHIGAATAELTLWESNFVKKVLQITNNDINSSPALAAATRKLLQNSGLYNGIVALGLAWSLLDSTSPEVVREFQSVLLCGVIVAGLYGFRAFNPPNYTLLASQAGVALAALIWIWI